MEEISGIICAVDPAREPARHAEARFDRTNRVGHLDKQQVATLAKARKEDALPRPRLLQHGGEHHQRMRGTAVAHFGNQRVGNGFRRNTDLLGQHLRSEEHTSELQSLMRISYAVFCLKKKKIKQKYIINVAALN